MLWLLLATFTACFEASKDLLSKRSLAHLNEYVVAWSLPVFTVLCLSPVLFWIDIPPLSHRFWLALCVGGSLNTVAFLLYTKAIYHSDLSITVPFVNFTPIFLLVTSPLIVQESLTLADAGGCFLIVAGSYVLNIQARHKSILAPIRAVAIETGPKLMLVVAFLWSITANLDKVGVQNSSPLFWLIAIYTFMALGMVPVVFSNVSHPLRQIRQHWPTLLPIGLSHAIAVSCQMIALTLTLVAHVVSIKRTSTLIAALLGHLLFQEPGIRARMTGASIMMLGVLFILWG